MASDAIFRMGCKHSVCQDYALAGHHFGLPWAVLSDGCSGVVDPERPGSPFTDFGARFLVLAALERPGPLSEGCFDAMGIIQAANYSCGSMLLPRTALDATLLFAIQTEGGDVQIYQTGDGVVAWREAGTGHLRYESVRYARGAPRYLSYALDPKAQARLLDSRFGRADAEPDDLMAGTLEVTSNLWTKASGWGPQLQRLCRWDESTSFERRLRVPGPRSDLSGGSLHARADVVVLLSDGVESFVDRDGIPVPLETVLAELLAFKNLGGEFATRRARRFLERTCAERGWRHEDDLSMAAVAPTSREESGQRTADSPGAEGSGS